MFKLFNFFKVKNQVFNFEHKKMLNKLSINIAEIPDNIKLTLQKNNSCCFRDNYKEFTDETKPDVINIDYKIDPIKIIKDIKIPVQGGLDPQILLTNRKKIKIQAQRYLDIFKNHPYIFNLGHGVLPQTNPDMVEYLINFVKNFK